jgi:hypothetical protein
MPVVGGELLGRLAPPVRRPQGDDDGAHRAKRRHGVEDVPPVIGDPA